MTALELAWLSGRARPIGSDVVWIVAVKQVLPADKAAPAAIHQWEWSDLANISGRRNSRAGRPGENGRRERRFRGADSLLRRNVRGTSWLRRCCARHCEGGNSENGDARCGEDHVNSPALGKRPVQGAIGSQGRR
jgi:hypothetical protein